MPSEKGDSSHPALPGIKEDRTMVQASESLITLVLRKILRLMKLPWSRKRYPPGPLRLPIIGGLWRFGFMLSLDTFMKLAKQYGNICTVWIGPIPAVILSGYKAVKEGLINHSDDFADRPETPFVKSAGKNRGIVLSNGHTWKQQRRFSVVTMRKLGLGKKGMEHQIEEAAIELVEIFARAKGQPFDPSLHIINSVCNVICAMSFGYRFSVEDKEFLRLIEAIRISLQFGGSFFHGLYEILPFVMKYLPGPHKTALSSIEMVVSFAKNEIAKHKEDQTVHEPIDFIDFYLSHMERNKDDPYSTFNEDNLAQCIFDLFIAGTETTATTLQWALLLMATHPDIQEKVYQEMEDVFGSSHSIRYQDRKKLPYTNAVIHEIQRSRYIFLIGVPRQTVKDVNLHGFHIPKGAVIAPDLRSVLLDPKEWATPEKFNPNHFLDEDGQFVDREAFLPFGAGARVCPGEQLAKIELFIFFTSLLRAFRFQLPKGVRGVLRKPIIGLTVRPRLYKICAVPRCSHINN
ncbi:cytochrome P450 2J2-like [Podarcis raffonei]|uniref:cytochrome P450 2J2-like n=1 Tax=Podarcis raffonei TaxID=65483 RepID=UPI00232922D5|nr:cytochrome P450 2J2-like [Podarcis raffonei]